MSIGYISIGFDNGFQRISNEYKKFELFYNRFPLYSEKEKELRLLISDLESYKIIAQKGDERLFIDEVNNLLSDIHLFKDSLNFIGEPIKVSNWSEANFLSLKNKKETLQIQFEQLDTVKRKKIVSEILTTYGRDTLNHMTHISNLEGILKQGLLSHNHQFSREDISNQGVNARRNRREPIYGNQIHDYVPFYFNIKNSMLYVVQKKYDFDIIILGFSPICLYKKEILFSNKNAATNTVGFTKNADDLLNKNFIDFDVVFLSDNWAGDTDLKQKMQAEILILDRVEQRHLEKIYVQHEQVKQYIIEKYKRYFEPPSPFSVLHGWRPVRVIVKPDLFF